MNFRPSLPRTIFALSSALSAPLALAHEGHGMPGVSHWHSTDALGFVAIVAAVAAYAWFKGDR